MAAVAAIAKLITLVMGIYNDSQVIDPTVLVPAEALSTSLFCPASSDLIAARW